MEEFVPLMRLPPEIHLIIIKHLELHDIFSLSKTCKQMHLTACCDWERELEGDDEAAYEFWFAIASTRKKVWACARCSRLHPIPSWVMPQLVHLTCPNLDTADNIRGSEPLYWGQAHVQIALKYSRLGSTDSGFLKAILQPIKIHMREKGLTFTCTPRIVNGKFVVCNYLEYNGNMRYLLSQRFPFFGPCPHGYFSRIWYDSVVHPELFKDAEGRVLTWEMKCSDCQIEYTAAFKLLPSGKMKIIIWGNSYLGDESTKSISPIHILRFCDRLPFPQ